MKSKKLLSLALAGVMTLALAAPAFAAEEAKTNEISSAGSTGQTTVTATIAPTTFSVTVPTNLAISVAADGTVTSASENVNIINNSVGKVKVTNVTATGANDWEVVAFDTKFSELPVGTKKIGLKINNADVLGETNSVASTFQPINGKASKESSAVTQTFTYTAAIPAQNGAIENNASVATITFTIGWDAVENA